MSKRTYIILEAVVALAYGLGLILALPILAALVR